MMVNRRLTIMLHWIPLLLIEFTICQTTSNSFSHNITCPFSSDCLCSSTQCIGPIQVWCTSNNQFPTFTANSNCEVDFLQIGGTFNNIPSRALVAFTDRITKLRMVPRPSGPLQIDPQAFQGSIGLFLERFELDDQRTVTTFPPALKTFKKLHTLILNNTAITEVPAAVLSDKILETLRISNGKVADIHRDAFLNLPFLFNLELPHNNLTSFPRDALLPVMSSLRALDLPYNQISTLEAGSLHGFDRLKLLNLSGNPLISIENGSLSGVQSSLVQLDLSKCQLSTFPVGALTDLNMLKTLDLSDNQISIMPQGALRGLTSLAELSLRRNPIKTIEIGSFIGSALTTFTLQSSSLERLDLAAFASAQSMSTLLVVDNPQLQHIYSSPSSADVVYTPLEVHLYNNNVTSIGRSIIGWLSAGAKIVTDGNDYFECNETELTWMAGAFKCFDSNPLIMTNTWCASEIQEGDIYYQNRTSLQNVLQKIDVDCRQFFASTEARTTTRPSGKEGNAASSMTVSLIAVALLVSNGLFCLRQAVR